MEAHLTTFRSVGFHGAVARPRQPALLRYLAFTFISLRRIDLRQNYDTVGQLESYGSLYDKYGAPFQWTLRGLYSWAKRACVSSGWTHGSQVRRCCSGVRYKAGASYFEVVQLSRRGRGLTSACAYHSCPLLVS